MMRIGVALNVLRALFALLLILSPLSFAEAGADSPFPPRRIAQQGGGVLKVHANVPGARVLIDGEEVGNAPNFRLLPPGRYRVRIERDGYEPYDEEIVIEPGKSVTIRAKLARIVGSIEVNTNVDGAEVYLDDVLVGKTPGVELSGVTSGTHVLRVIRPGYVTYEGPVTIEPNVRLRLNLELTPSAGVLMVSSVPPGAEVRLDDEIVGKTPLTLENVRTGRHALSFELPGYARHFDNINISAGQRLEVHSTLEEVGGGLRVKSRPAGAIVYINGSRLGTTPLATGEIIEPGSYSLRVSLDGFSDYVQPLTIEAERTAKLRVRLETLDGGDGRAEAPRGVRERLTGLTRRWWFWPAVGGIVLATAGGATAAAMSGAGAAEPVGDVSVSLP